MPPYTYQEPKKNEFAPFPEGDYDFIVVGMQEPETNEKGTFIVPIEIQLDTGRKLRHWLCAGVSPKGPFDMIAPFLKAIGKAPEVGKEPDLSWKNLNGAKGVCHVKEKVEKTGKYAGEKFPKVAWWIFEEDVEATKAADAMFAKDQIPGMGSGNHTGALAGSGATAPGTWGSF